jgi:hypothetical protein
MVNSGPDNMLNDILRPESTVMRTSRIDLDRTSEVGSMLLGRVHIVTGITVCG